MPQVFVFCTYLMAGITKRVDTTGARQAINGIFLLLAVAHPPLTFLNVVNVLFGLGKSQAFCHSKMTLLCTVIVSAHGVSLILSILGRKMNYINHLAWYSTWQPLLKNFQAKLIFCSGRILFSLRLLPFSLLLILLSQRSDS